MPLRSVCADRLLLLLRKLAAAGADDEAEPNPGEAHVDGRLAAPHSVVGVIASALLMCGDATACEVSRDGVVGCWT